MVPQPDMTTTPTLFKHVDFLMRFCPWNPSEKRMLDRFGEIDIGAGDTQDCV
jgi:hypothetical protein